jgi:hypothetical protein
MKRKLFGISATLAILLAFGLVLASCGDDDDGGGGNTVTFTLANSGTENKAFTLKVEGASWTNKSGTLLTADMETDFHETLGEVIRLEVNIDNWSFDPDTQTFTATANSALTGSVTFQEEIYGARVTDGGHSDTYVGTPADGLTFDAQ